MSLIILCLFVIDSVLDFYHQIFDPPIKNLNFPQKDCLRISIDKKLSDLNDLKKRLLPQNFIIEICALLQNLNQNLKFLVIALRKYVTFLCLQTLCDGLETPTQWKYESVTEWLFRIGTEMLVHQNWNWNLKLLVIAFRKKITSLSLWRLCDSLETPTQWKYESVTKWLFRVGTEMLVHQNWIEI